MREILYDMIHNSIWGKEALGFGVLYILYFAVYCVLCSLYKKYYKVRDLRKWKRTLKKIVPKKTHIITICGVVFFFFIMFLLFDWRVEHHEYNYCHIALAEQTDSDVLFRKELKKEYEKSKFESEEWIGQLHISEENPMVEITKENIEDKYELFESIYQIGEKESGNGKKNDETTRWLQELRKEVTNKKSVTLEEYIEEYKKWDILFEYYGLSSDLYQSSRSAKDALVKWDSSVSEKEMLEIAGDAIYKSECFLKYKDRNIHEEGESIIVGIKDIAFSNGKVYSQLYMKSQKEEGMKKYDKEFLVNAYVSMVYAEKEISKEDIDYAKINYYIGDICEKMLDEISNKDEWYIEVAKEALEHYEIAWESLKLKVGYYKQEHSMRKNIENGINRLENF